MSAVGATHAHHDDHADHGDGLYWRTFVALAILTAVEVSTEWWPEGLGWITTAALIVMMTIKFILVAQIFMHLRDDHNLLGQLFYFGAILAIAVFMGVFGSMRIFEKSGLGGEFTFNDPTMQRPLPPPPTDPPPIIRETTGGH
ncbi:MAG TPA: cytochrome C oxidase subunit IV family protein [Microthrixaceae bacterium]|nr:cytochrome C oxidase subunit IV family protein [Microthrixaceae bacterium]